MKKWILLSLFAAASALSAEEPKPIHDETFYVDIGSPMLPIPILGAGFRAQSNQIGFDASLKTAVVLLPIGVRANASLLYYPEPKLSEQYYFGGGLSASAPFRYLSYRSWSGGQAFFGPSFVFGQSYRTKENSKRFWQVSADLYFQRDAGRIRFVPAPIVFFNYGFCF